MVHDTVKFLYAKKSKRIWVISDLQQSVYESAQRCLKCAVDDFKGLNLDCVRIMYLGDAVEGSDFESIKKMTEMQVNELELGIEIRYLLGNHEFDFYKFHKINLGRMEIPFYEMVKGLPNWGSSQSLEDFYFFEEFDDFAIVCLTDHAAQDGAWYTTHGEVYGNKLEYPYGEKEYYGLINKISQIKKPVFTFSHYAFAGGNRPSALLDYLLPLPGNVKIHFYGYAHIGDSVWAGKDCFRKIACVDSQNIPQINASSLEDIRGSAVRSVFLEIYEDGGYGVLFRNHSKKKWEEAYII